MKKRRKGRYIMKIIIVGCGKIGTTVLHSLTAEGHDVVAVDINADLITEISTLHDAMYVVGNGADSDVLEEAGANDAELLVAVTGSDELNMLSCFLARKMGTKHTIAHYAAEFTCVNFLAAREK